MLRGFQKVFLLALVAMLPTAITNAAPASAPTSAPISAPTSASISASISAPTDDCAANIEHLHRRAAPEIAGSVSLRDALAALSKSSGVSIRGLWKGTVADSGLDADRKLRIEGSISSCAALLEAIVDKVSQPSDPVMWQCTASGLEVGPRSLLWREKAMQVRVYEVKDLLLRVPNFRSSGVPTASGGSSAGSGGGSGGSGTAGGNTTDTDADAKRQLRVDELMRLIQTTVQPAAWADQGGPCTMAARDGVLVIRAPDFVHREIENPRMQNRQRPPSDGSKSKP